MTRLINYLNDGANHQAKAVLAFIQDITIEESWNEKKRDYDAEINVARWENCREQGYVLMLRSKNYCRQLNIAFFEHRNSDAICAVKWEQSTMNTPNISDAKFGNVYKDKYDVSHTVNYGQVLEMAEWIEKTLLEFWNETKDEPHPLAKN